MPNAQFYINLFEAIPEETWGTQNYETKPAKPGEPPCYCALGHLGVRYAGQVSTTPKAAELVDMFRSHVGMSVLWVNDYETKEFPQKHPKYRILAALHQIKGLTNEK